MHSIRDGTHQSDSLPGTSALWPPTSIAPDRFDVENQNTFAHGEAHLEVRHGFTLRAPTEIGVDKYGAACWA